MSTVEIKSDEQNVSVEEQAKQQNNNVIANEDGTRVEIQQSETVSTEPSKEERPNWLPEKFKSAEELAKAYSELETKMSSNSSDQPEETNAEENIQQPEDVQALGKYYDEWANNQELSEESYNELAKMGLSKDLVDGYIEGQKALADNDVSSIHKVVGGEDNYAKLLDWSSKNLSQAEKDAFNETIDGGSTEQVKIAVSGLMARAGMTAENPQQSLFEGEVNNTSTDVYGSIAQVTEAMNDPRYEKDPAYRKEVQDKLSRSTVI